jgi:hypothetical protein
LDNSCKFIEEIKDLNFFNTEYASSLAQTLGVQVPALTTAGNLTLSSSSSAISQPDMPSSLGVSKGAKAGISLGMIVGMLFAALGMYDFCIRKRQGVAVEDTRPDRAEQGEYLPEMEDQDLEHASRKFFIKGEWRSEADAAQKVGEMINAPDPTSVAPVELEARRPVCGK